MTDGETGLHHLEKREGSTYMLSKTFTRRVFGIMVALFAIALACTMPCLALAADDSLGSVDEPAKSADGNASSYNHETGAGKYIVGRVLLFFAQADSYGHGRAQAD